jgi:hypothetical protein
MNSECSVQAPFILGHNSLWTRDEGGFSTLTCLRCSLLATLMLPDGAHLFSEDWTVFYLNQTPALSITSSSSEGRQEKGRILYVLSLMRTKKDDSVRR